MVAILQKSLELKLATFGFELHPLNIHLQKQNIGISKQITSYFNLEYEFQ